MDLVLKLNEQLKEIEREFENAIQSRQSELATTPPTVIPTISTVVPSTLAASLAPTLPPVTTLLVAKAIPTIGTSTNAWTTTEKTYEVIKTMEQMSIQAIELKNLKEKISRMEIDYELAQIQNKEEERKNKIMEERIRVLEKDLTLEKPLGDRRNILWANIIDSINDIWPFI